jgi:Fungal specific transcription factor domain/Fungal Zn(2)-Cys(6) binuclear cluster domain
LRCDGSFPCSRCRSKGSDCSYPGRGRNRIASIKEPHENHEEFSLIPPNPSQSSIESQALPIKDKGASSSAVEAVAGVSVHQAETNQLSIASRVNKSIQLQDFTSLDTLSQVSVDLSLATSANIFQDAGFQASTKDALILSSPLHVDIPDLPNGPFRRDPHSSKSIATSISGAEHLLGDDRTSPHHSSALASTVESGYFSAPGIHYDNATSRLEDQTVMEPTATFWPSYTDFIAMDLLFGDYMVDRYESVPLSFHSIDPPQNTHENIHGPSIPQHTHALLNNGLLRKSQSENSETQWPTYWNPTYTDNDVEFPDMSSVPVDIVEAESYGHVDSINETTYHTISQYLLDILPKRPHFRKFKNANLPKLKVFDCFIQLYFEHFHPTFPMMHKPTFKPASEHWLLSLATAAIGCQYSKVPQANMYAVALQELLRRAIFDSVRNHQLHVSCINKTHINYRLNRITPGYANYGLRKPSYSAS